GGAGARRPPAAPPRGDAGERAAARRSGAPARARAGGVLRGRRHRVHPAGRVGGRPRRDRDLARAAGRDGGPAMTRTRTTWGALALAWVAASAIPAAAAPRAAAEGEAEAVTCRLLEIRASNEPGGIDRELGPLKAKLQRPPFSAWSRFA